jgi:hypothetical protein
MSWCSILYRATCIFVWHLCEIQLCKEMSVKISTGYIYPKTSKEHTQFPQQNIYHKQVKHLLHRTSGPLKIHSHIIIHCTLNTPLTMFYFYFFNLCVCDWLRAGRRVGSLSRSWVKNFLHVVQPHSGAHPASYSMGTRGKAAGAWSWPLTN